MSRKQALFEAAQTLQSFNDPENHEYYLKLANMLLSIADEVSKAGKIKWTKDRVFDSVKKYIEENEFISARVFDEVNMLPCHTVINTLFNMTAKEFLVRYFPENIFKTKYHAKPKEYWMEEFKKEYMRINAYGMEDYNERRNRDLPCARTLCSLLGCSTYNEVLDLVGLEIVGDNEKSRVRRTKKSPNYSIESNVENLFSMNDVTKMDELCKGIDNTIAKYL